MWMNLNTMFAEKSYKSAQLYCNKTMDKYIDKKQMAGWLVLDSGNVG